jgi:hypothetical protein
LRDLEPIGEALWKNVAEGRYRSCRIRSPRWIGTEFGPQPYVAVPFDMRLKSAGRGTHDIALASCTVSPASTEVAPISRKVASASWSSAFDPAASNFKTSDPSFHALAASNTAFLRCRR